MYAFLNSALMILVTVSVTMCDRRKVDHVFDLVTVASESMTCVWLHEASGILNYTFSAWTSQRNWQIKKQIHLLLRNPVIDNDIHRWNGGLLDGSGAHHCVDV